MFDNCLASSTSSSFRACSTSLACISCISPNHMWFAERKQLLVSRYGLMEDVRFWCVRLQLSQSSGLLLILIAVEEWRILSRAKIVTNSHMKKKQTSQWPLLESPQSTEHATTISYLCGSTDWQVSVQRALVRKILPHTV